MELYKYIVIGIFNTSFIIAGLAAIAAAIWSFIAFHKENGFKPSTFLLWVLIVFAVSFPIAGPLDQLKNLTLNYSNGFIFGYGLVAAVLFVINGILMSLSKWEAWLKALGVAGFLIASLLLTAWAFALGYLTLAYCKEPVFWLLKGLVGIVDFLICAVCLLGLPVGIGLLKPKR